MSQTRRLTAILAADVAGFSRLMGADEAGTARALRKHRAAADPLVAGHGGRIVKTTGDGVLIEFASVVGAVDCAVALQILAAERNAAIPGDRRMEWRIGVHLGDVLVEGDDILGDGVNIAARPEGIAEPGGICLSEDAFRQVRGKVEAEFADIGEQALKNIARPVRVYRIGPQASRPQAAETPALPISATARKSCSTGARGKLRVMKTRRERRSSSGQSSSSTGRCATCCTAWTTTGPRTPSTATSPLTRSKSGPRSAVSTAIACSNTGQGSGLAKNSAKLSIPCEWACPGR